MTRFASTLVSLLCAGTPLAAGIEPGMTVSWGSGFVHPFLGADHLLAMVAVGALAALHRGWARLALPAVFLVGMGLGLLLGASGIHIPLVEMMILSSVVVLGGLLAFGISLPVTLGAGLAAVFSFFHGEAHGLEMEGAEFLPFALGVLVATAVLQAWGLALVSMLMKGLERPMARTSLRILGAGLTLGGVALVVGG